MKLPKIINYYAGPGTGKSTTATAVFSELKQLGINCEYVSEYAKDATWERRGPKVFQAQEYLFGKQHFRMSRVSDEVDIIITDSPILLTLVYMPEGFGMPSLVPTVKEAYALYDNLDIFLERNKPYNPKGRNQTLEQAKELDGRIKGILHETSQDEIILPYGRKAIAQTIRDAAKKWGDDIPALHDFVPNFQPVLTRKMLPPSGETVLAAEGQLVVYLEPTRVHASGAVVENGWYDLAFQVRGEEIPPPKWWMPLITDEDVFGVAA